MPRGRINARGYGGRTTGGSKRPRGAGYDRWNVGKLRLSTRGYRPIGRYGRGSCTGGPAYKKFHDLVIGPTLVPLFNSGTANMSDSLNLVAEGPAFNERIGRLLCLRKVQMSYDIRFDGTDEQLIIGTPPQDPAQWVIRVALVLDRQCNGSAATMEEIWDMSSGSAAGPMAFRNVDNTGRFNVLYNRVHNIEQVVQATDDGTNTNFLHYSGSNQFYMQKTIEIPIHFKGSTAVLTNIQDNNLLLYVGLANSGIGNAQCRFKSVVRLRFED